MYKFTQSKIYALWLCTLPIYARVFRVSLLLLCKDVVITRLLYAHSSPSCIWRDTISFSMLLYLQPAGYTRISRSRVCIRESIMENSKTSTTCSRSRRYTNSILRNGYTEDRFMTLYGHRRWKSSNDRRTRWSLGEWQPASRVSSPGRNRSCITRQSNKGITPHYCWFHACAQKEIHTVSVACVQQLAGFFPFRFN